MLAQAKASRGFFHPNAHTLQKQFQLTATEAREIVESCDDCHALGAPLPAGVNHRGLKALELWQTDVTQVAEFGRLKYVHVTVDTFSSAMWASAHTGEKARDVITHWRQAFAVLGIPSAVKTDNGPAYASQQIPLHPDDAPCFAFSVPTLNQEASRKRYHWKFLPQGMKNSPFICQWYLSSLLSPVCAAVGEAIILHYMDDVLVCAPNDDLLSHALDLTIDSLVAAGFELQEEKIQRMPPSKYLGLEIDASGASHKSVITWKDPQTQQWEKVIVEVEGSPQVAELAAVVRAFEKFPEPFNLVTDSAYAAEEEIKSKSVCIVTEEDVAGPLHPAEETETEIVTRSLSLGELRYLQREFTHQTNKSILTWLLRIWDAAANDTILEGSEARQLGSLSRDVVIDQGIGRTQQTLSLWRQL
ncbi:hypothetical protein DUI87_03509 [Hirundo rustica rustica]|uniref:Uncharacterized protein n=1 Tax=Hirundo rustica rustica TaxID=333673 RepID=A0A3M0L2Y5_HIRRU|nr:hypothetical protein DUI87_03509 [Hirundo rustica rustica]